MIEQLVGEICGLWKIITTYPIQAIFPFSITLNLMLGYHYLELRERYNRVSSFYDRMQEGYIFVSREHEKLEQKLKKYQKYENRKKPLTKTKHKIKNKLKEVK